MAELTVMEEKLAEVLGLAMAAKAATDKVSGLTEDPALQSTLERMAAEAGEAEERCTDVASELDGKKTAILEKARETKAEAAEMMKTYLGEDAEALDGFEFLTMAEAGEVGHPEHQARRLDPRDPQPRDPTQQAITARTRQLRYTPHQPTPPAPAPLPLISRLPRPRCRRLAASASRC